MGREGAKESLQHPANFVRDLPSRYQLGTLGKPESGGQLELCFELSLGSERNA
jgi:hypothetical protein